jgi:hypothetical protein
LVDRHDDGAEVAGSSPSGSSPPHHLNLVAVAGWAQAGNRTIGAPAVERVAAVGADDLDTAAREGIGDDAVTHVVGSGRHHRDLLCQTGFLCRVQQAEQDLGS